MASISSVSAPPQRCASTPTRTSGHGAPIGTTRIDFVNGHVATPKIGILRLVVVADRDTDAEAAARSAHQVWFRSITQLWHEHDDHSIDGLFSWETAIQHKSIIFGSPDRVRGEMQRVATESGCNYVICSFAWGTLSREQSMRSLDLFASDVMPAFATG